MVTKDNGGKKQTKEKLIQSKKNTIKKISELITDSEQSLEVNIGKNRLRIEAKNSISSDEKNKQQGEIKKNMDIKEIKPDIPSESFNEVKTNSMNDNDMLDSTEVYDEGDLASAYERGFIQEALNRHKEKLAPETHPDFDGENCIDCGLEIPVFRLNLGKIRCVVCQDKLEKRKKLYA